LWTDKVQGAFKYTDVRTLIKFYIMEENATCHDLLKEGLGIHAPSYVTI